MIEVYSLFMTSFSLFCDQTEENFPDQYIMVESFVNIHMVDISKF